uniref:Uncharacterized protein n=1 Tax=Aegilops tauschii TaxID=37682 RepID=M8CU37_AEGTA
MAITIDKYTIRILVLALLSIHLLSSATVAHCGTITVGADDEKIDLPNGLCGKEKLCRETHCYCCLLNDRCYRTMDVCKSHCDTPPSSSQDMLAAVAATATATTPAPLPPA